MQRDYGLTVTLPWLAGQLRFCIGGRSWGAHINAPRSKHAFRLLISQSSTCTAGDVGLEAGGAAFVTIQGAALRASFSAR